MEGVPWHSPAPRGPRGRRRVTLEDLILAALFFAAALLYSSVGHAGASAYLAAMALVGVPVVVMRPTALVLNLFVASIVTVRFAMAGHLPWRSLIPLAIGSVPAAFIGGSIDLPGEFIGRSLRPCSCWRLAPRHLASPRRRRHRAWRPLDFGDLERRSDRPVGRLDRHRRRHLPDAAPRSGRLDRNARRSRAVGVVHPRELDRRAGRPLERGLALPQALPLWIGAVAAGGSSVRGSAQPASACST